jgi:capsular exopolysaccharide synthesis family protein
MNKEFNKLIAFLDVGDFRFIILILNKNLINLLFLSILVSILTLIISMNIEKKFESVATIVISPEENNIVNIEEVYTNENQINRVNNQIAILKSDEVLEFIVEDKKKTLEFKRLYSKVPISTFQRLIKKKVIVDKEYIKNMLSKNFEVSNLPRSDVLKLKFTSNDSRISQLALKSIISSYQRYEVDSKIQITNYAKTKISSRLEDLVMQIDIAEKNLSQYKKENNLVDTGGVKQLKIGEIESISKRIIEAKQEFQKKQNDLLSIKIADGDIDALLAIEDLRSLDQIKSIKESLSANDSQIQSLSLIYTESHPKLTKAYDYENNLKQQLKEEVNLGVEQKAFELSNLDNFIKLSDDELKKATDELQIIEEKESGMMKFLREVESSTKLYESFLQRVKETNESQNLQISKLKIIEMPSLSKNPVSPQPTKNFIIALCFSFVGFFALIYYKELNLSVLKSPESLDSLDIPQIGALPRVEKIKKGYHILQMFLEDSESNFSESIRSARAIIESKFNQNCSYMVTSSNPSEGKTSFAFNLALSLEKTKKVLFIEADIRRPSVLNSFYKFDKEILGLGEIITGSATLKNTIFKVPGTELDIITSGEKRFDMSDIVNRDQIKKFFDTLKIEYDYVIIDSPPVQPVSDTLILAQATDYNLFLIRSEETRTVTFMSAIKKVQSVGAKIDGIIINDLDTSKDSYYSYYYNYSPGYYNYYSNKKS